ncbi:MAG: hypothetical protein K2Z81_04895 [Cyanobacteria bacterium]|nr:hypothetical protein [Cyanobacteriota bacterium]
MQKADGSFARIFYFDPLRMIERFIRESRTVKQMGRKGIIAVVLVAVSWSLAIPRVSADEQKDELIRIIRQEDSPLQAMTAERFITLKLSPEWWQYMLNRETKAYRLISNLANGVLGFCNNMKWGDVAKLDESGDGKSPLVEQALADLQGKVQCTIELTDNVK